MAAYPIDYKTEIVSAPERNPGLPDPATHPGEHLRVHVGVSASGRRITRIYRKQWVTWLERGKWPERDTVYKMATWVPE